MPLASEVPDEATCKNSDSSWRLSPGLSTWTVHLTGDVPDASAASADDTCLHAPINDYSGDHHEHDCYF
jgi:hypothetical protein